MLFLDAFGFLDVVVSVFTLGVCLVVAFVIISSMIVYTWMCLLFALLITFSNISAVFLVSFTSSKLSAISAISAGSK